MKKHIPNFVTCLNLFSGCMGIVFAFQGNLIWASYAIVIAAIFDFFDGMLARLLNAYSEIGKELDSLADMVSFGVLPAVIVYHLFAISPQPEFGGTWLSFSAFIITVFSALRLAKFNLDTRQSENFIGLPTPANALLIASFPLIIAENNPFFADFILNQWFLMIFSLSMSLLLIAEVPLISLKFKSLKFKDNLLRYILIFSSILLLWFLKFEAVPIIIIIYFLISLIQFRSSGKNLSQKY
ncbi:MAG: CDP-diacylglycerol--serine O-phosphatidyltransferase [Daejeonella sp.]|uniref:CDP-diacylglycerol--serine O-phosphatidyltransferase n=1 Tax=Daejeonella sp. TaxID=2805397 RepID=UPI002733F441|nr:CDP-diacylglycerol--serine O-phosphatidyltransferase [Daejeonella sp.]MDP3468388.1 CDP-diacylglycerol--serine O-phosphatidyltransferase [Daejeonella sp.]